MTELFAAPRPAPAPSLTEFLHHGYAGRRPAAAIFGGVLATSLIAAALVSPSFRATAVLVVLPAPEFTVREAAGSHEANASILALDQIMKAETEILGSDDLHAATLSALGPAQVYPALFAPAHRGLVGQVLHAVTGFLLAPWRTTPRDADAALAEKGLQRFRSDLTVLPAKDSNVITVTYDNKDGETAARTVNSMLTLYAARRTHLYDDPQIGIVRREVSQGADAVAATDRALADFKRTHGIADYGTERDLLLHRLFQARQAVADSQASVAEYQARLTSLSRALRAEPTTIGVFDERDSDTRLQAVNAGLQDLRAKLAAARDKYKDSSRVVTTLQAELASHEAESARLTRDSTQSVVRQGRNPSLDPLRLDRARAAAELAASLARLAASQDQASRANGDLVRIGEEETALAQLQRRKDAAEVAFQDASRILAERHLSEAEEASRLANVRVIQKADVPQAPRPTRLLVAAGGFSIASVAACGYLLTRFLRRPVFLTGEGLEAATGLPVLAVFEQERETGILLTT